MLTFPLPFVDSVSQSFLFGGTGEEGNFSILSLPFKNFNYCKGYALAYNISPKCSIQIYNVLLKLELPH